MLTMSKQQNAAGSGSPQICDVFKINVKLTVTKSVDQHNIALNEEECKIIFETLDLIYDDFGKFFEINFGVRDVSFGSGDVFFHVVSETNLEQVWKLYQDGSFTDLTNKFLGDNVWNYVNIAGSLSVTLQISPLAYKLGKQHFAKVDKEMRMNRNDKDKQGSAYTEMDKQGSMYTDKDKQGPLYTGVNNEKQGSLHTNTDKQSPVYTDKDKLDPVYSNKDKSSKMDTDKNKQGFMHLDKDGLLYTRKDETQPSNRSVPVENYPISSIKTKDHVKDSPTEEQKNTAGNACTPRLQKSYANAAASVPDKVIPNSTGTNNIQSPISRTGGDIFQINAGCKKLIFENGSFETTFWVYIPEAYENIVGVRLEMFNSNNKYDYPMCAHDSNPRLWKIKMKTNVDYHYNYMIEYKAPYLLVLKQNKHEYDMDKKVLMHCAQRDIFGLFCNQKDIVSAYKLFLVHMMVEIQTKDDLMLALEELQAKHGDYFKILKNDPLARFKHELTGSFVDWFKFDSRPFQAAFAVFCISQLFWNTETLQYCIQSVNADFLLKSLYSYKVDELLGKYYIEDSVAIVLIHLVKKCYAGFCTWYHVVLRCAVSLPSDQIIKSENQFDGKTANGQIMTDIVVKLVNLIDKKEKSTDCDSA